MESLRAAPTADLLPILNQVNEIKSKIEKQVGENRYEIKEDVLDFATERGKNLRLDVARLIGDTNKKIAAAMKAPLSEDAMTKLLSVRDDLARLNSEIRSIDTDIERNNKNIKLSFFQKIFSWLAPKEEVIPTFDYSALSKGLRELRKQSLERVLEAPEADISEKMKSLTKKLPPSKWSGSWAAIKFKEDDKEHKYELELRVMKKEERRDEPVINKITLQITDEGYETKRLPGKVFKSFNDALQYMGATQENLQTKIKQGRLEEGEHFAKGVGDRKMAEDILKETFGKTDKQNSIYVVWQDKNGYHLSGINKDGKFMHVAIDLEKFEGTVKELAKTYKLELPFASTKKDQLMKAIEPFRDVSVNPDLVMRGKAVLSKMERNKPYYLLRIGAGGNEVELITLIKKRGLFGRDYLSEPPQSTKFPISSSGEIEGFETQKLQGGASFQTLETRSDVFHNISGLGAYIQTDAIAQMDDCRKKMGDKANGGFAFYTTPAKSGDVDLHICYIKGGKLKTLPIDITSAETVGELKELKKEALQSKLLEKAGVAGLDTKKEYKALDHVRAAIDKTQNALTTKEPLAVDYEAASKRLNNVITSLGRKPEGAYALYPDQGKVMALVIDDKGNVQKYSLDLTSNPGSVTRDDGFQYPPEDALTKIGAKEGCVGHYKEVIEDLNRRRSEVMPSIQADILSLEDDKADQLLVHAALVGAKNVWFTRPIPNTAPGLWSKTVALFTWSEAPKGRYYLSVVHREGNKFKIVEREITRDEVGFAVDGKSYKDAAGAAQELLISAGYVKGEPIKMAHEVEQNWNSVKAMHENLKENDSSDMLEGKPVATVISALDEQFKPVRHYNIAAAVKPEESFTSSYKEGDKTTTREIMDRFPKAYTLSWGNKTARIDILKEPGKLWVGDKKFDKVGDLVKDICGPDMRKLETGIVAKKEADRLAALKKREEEAIAKALKAEEDALKAEVPEVTAPAKQTQPMPKTTKALAIPTFSVNNNNRWVQIGSRLAMAYDWWEKQGKPPLSHENADLLLRRIHAKENKPEWDKKKQLQGLSKIIDLAKKNDAEAMGLEDKSKEYCESLNAFLDMLKKTAGI